MGLKWILGEHLMKWILSMEEQLFYNKAFLVFKILNDQAPNYLDALLCRAAVRYGSLNLIKPLSRIDLFQTSLSFSGADYWNKLPYELKNTKTISCFKRNLKKHINILNLKNMQQQFWISKKKRKKIKVIWNFIIQGFLNSSLKSTNKTTFAVLVQFTKESTCLFHTFDVHDYMLVFWAKPLACNVIF